MAEARCEGCGATIAAGTGERTVTCGSCGRAQPHPRALPIGQAVLVPGASNLDLGRVATADHPDRIAVESKKTRVTSSYAVEQVIPVILDSDEVKPGERVWAGSVVGFEPTWVASIDGRMVKVKHPNEKFQSPFFDKKVSRTQVAIALRPRDREHRAVPNATWASFAYDPAGFLFRGFFAALGLAIVVVSGLAVIGFVLMVLHAVLFAR
jgi:hypothetical protein